MTPLEKIHSFTIDHDTMQPGFYELSRVHGVVTYDLRLKKPNTGDYIAQAALHSIEHMFATVIRNSAAKENVVYFGPMGCRTGFYLLLWEIGRKEALSLVRACVEQCLALECVPGTLAVECGNCAEHDLEGARKELNAYARILAELD